MASLRNGSRPIEELRAMLTTLGYRVYNINEDGAHTHNDPSPWAIQWHQNKTYVCRFELSHNDASRVWYRTEREAIETFLEAYKNGTKIIHGPE